MRDVILVDIRCLPQLDGVMFLGLALRFEAQQLTGFKERPAAADQRSTDLLFDQVVLQQHVGAGVSVVEDEQKVLAVGRGNGPLKQHVGQAVVEGFVLTVLQVVAIGEDESVIIGQQYAGILDGIQPHGLLQLFVVDQITILLFLIRLHLQQNDVPDGGILNVGVIQCLVGIIDGFGVNPGAGVCVVFDLDGQVASHGFDEHSFQNGDMGMIAVVMVVSCGASPFEVMLWRKTKLVIAAIVDIPQRCPVCGGGVYQPFEHLDFTDRPADSEHHVQVRTAECEFGKHRILVVAEQITKIASKVFVVQQLQVFGRQGVVSEGVDGEHICRFGFRLQSEVDVVAEQESLADGHHVSRKTVVVGGNPLRTQQSGVDGPEYFSACFVQLIQSGSQFAAGAEQSVANDLIRTALQTHVRWGAVGRLVSRIGHGAQTAVGVQTTRLDRPGCQQRAVGVRSGFVVRDDELTGRTGFTTPDCRPGLRPPPQSFWWPGTNRPRCPAFV